MRGGGQNMVFITFYRFPYLSWLGEALYVLLNSCNRIIRTNIAIRVGIIFIVGSRFFFAVDSSRAFFSEFSSFASEKLDSNSWPCLVSKRRIKQLFFVLISWSWLASSKICVAYDLSFTKLKRAATPFLLPFRKLSIFSTNFLKI